MKLEFDSIALEFGMNRILSSIHMNCNVDEVVGLLGRNGSGKSCLMRVVFGSLSAQSKSVRIDGRYLSGDYLKQQLMGYLPQNDLLPDFVTFERALKLYKIDAARVENFFPELIDFIKKRPHEISGGQRRLFEALLILFAPHPFCFLDEPFSGLMPLHAERLAEIIRLEKSRKGIIVSDHLHRQVRTMADRLYVMVNGKTYAIKSEDQLIELGYLSEV